MFGSEVRLLLDLDLPACFLSVCDGVTECLCAFDMKASPKGFSVTHVWLFTQMCR